jgi:hypothetical protein
MPQGRKRFTIPKKPTDKTVEGAMEVVTARQDFARQFEDLDDFIFRGEEVDAKAFRAMEFNLRRVRAALARILWNHDVFIGIEVIDRLLFDLVVNDKAPVLWTAFFDTVQRHRLHRAGFVVYPLHSYGVLGLGFFRVFENGRADLILEEAGIAITAQTNKQEDTVSFLDRSRRAFRISQKLPLDLIEHFIRSRPLNWITSNALLVQRVRSFSGTYYENQFIYKLKLQMSTALIMMLAVMDTRSEADETLTYGSSARVNNFQTFDIKHYLTFEAAIGRRTAMSAHCIPMNVDGLGLLHLSDLNVDIDPRYWKTVRARKRLALLQATLSTIERGFVRHILVGDRNSPRARVYRKLVNSIEFFRRSFSATTRHLEAVVSLAIAFESLLIDHYRRGVTIAILSHVRVCLQGNKGIRRYTGAVAQLFESRGEIVHKGSASDFDQMAEAQRAYVLCLQYVVPQLDRLRATDQIEVLFSSQP